MWSKDPAWDPDLLYRIHEAIQRCIRVSTPWIEVFKGTLNPRDDDLLLCFASAFNPPTRAHEALLKEALRRSPFRAALLMLDVHHADKAPQDALLEDRVLMMCLAFAKEERFCLGICSHGRYLDKVRALRTILPPRTRITFLVGWDNWIRILDPRFYQKPDEELKDLFGQAQFLVFSRSEAGPVPSEFPASWPVRFLFSPKSAEGISSTRVRQAVARGEDPSPWVHPKVLCFIHQTGLYARSQGELTLYQARKMLLERIFRQGPEPFRQRGLREEALSILSASKDDLP